MPSLSQITANFFVNLINRLGVRPPPVEAFLLSNVVQPVSIVDADITLSSVATTQLLDTPLTAGVQATPAANFVLADSGAQPAGNYSVYIFLSAFDPVTSLRLAMQRRDSANAVNIWEQRFYESASAGSAQALTLTLQARVALQLNERIRVITINAGGAGSEMLVNVWITPTS